MTEKGKTVEIANEKSSSKHHECEAGCECPCSVCQLYRDAYQQGIDFLVPRMAADADARAFYLLTGEDYVP